MVEQNQKKKKKELSIIFHVLVCLCMCIVIFFSQSNVHSGFKELNMINCVYIVNFFRYDCKTKFDEINRSAGISTSGIFLIKYDFNHFNGCYSFPRFFLFLSDFLIFSFLHSLISSHGKLNETTKITVTDDGRFLVALIQFVHKFMFTLGFRKFRGW